MTSDRRNVMRQVLGLTGLLWLSACGGGGGDGATASGGASNGGSSDGGSGGGSTDGGSGTGSLSISVQPQSSTVRSGSTVTLTVVAGGTGALSYLWQRNGAAIAGATSASYTTPSLTYADNGAVFSVVVRDSVSTVSSNPATLTVTPRVVDVSATQYASFALLEDGTMWGWGSDDGLGVGSTVVQAGTAVKPTLSDGSILSGIRRLARGENAMFAVKNDGSLWGWGYNNSDGQLGDGTRVPHKVPSPVLSTSGTPLTGVVAAASATEHTLALKSDGTVWAWGGNTFGQLGVGTTSDDVLAPVQVLTAAGTPLTNVTQVSAHDLFSAALRDDGTVWTWGYGWVQGNLGNGVTANINALYAARVETSAGEALTNVTAVSCGAAHCLALLSDGTVRAWGAGNTGQLGNGSRDSNNPRPVVVTDGSGAAFGSVKAVAAGFNVSVVLRKDGTVWTFGQNAMGALGIGLSTTLGTSSMRLNPVQVQTADGQPLTGIAAVSVYQFHVVALAEDGTIWTWGYNAYGQVGDGTTTTRTAAFHIDGL